MWTVGGVRQARLKHVGRIRRKRAVAVAAAAAAREARTAIGPDSAFHWNGLGLLPYKDTFFSNTSEVTKSTNSRFVNFKESNPLTHALMSTLSMAQVTFSDEIGHTNKSLVMMICNEDGVTLKPDRPATSIDAQFNASKCCSAIRDKAAAD